VAWLPLALLLVPLFVLFIALMRIDLILHFFYGDEDD